MLIMSIAIIFVMFLLYSWLNISIKEIKKQLDRMKIRLQMRIIKMKNDKL